MLFLFDVRVYAGQYLEGLIWKFNLFVVRVWGEQYRKEMIFNITGFFSDCLEKAIQRGTDIECYFECCEGLGSA